MTKIQSLTTTQNFFSSIKKKRVVSYLWAYSLYYPIKKHFILFLPRAAMQAGLPEGFFPILRNNTISPPAIKPTSYSCGTLEARGSHYILDYNSEQLVWSYVFDL